MRSVLITGAAGFIGSTLAAYFRQQGVTVFADAEPGHPGNTTTRWPISESSLLQVAAGSTPDLIIHGAGSGTVAKVASQPELELPASLGAWLAVLQYARLHAPRARVVLLSSAARYGNAPATPQREDETRSPLSLYGMTKAHAEDCPWRDDIEVRPLSPPPLPAERIRVFPPGSWSSGGNMQIVPVVSVMP